MNLYFPPGNLTQETVLGTVMSHRIEEQYREILSILDAHPEGLHRGEISDPLENPINNKTLQRRLTELASDEKVTIKGKKRGTKYFPAQAL